MTRLRGDALWTCFWCATDGRPRELTWPSPLRDPFAARPLRRDEELVPACEKQMTMILSLPPSYMME